MLRRMIVPALILLAVGCTRTPPQAVINVGHVHAPGGTNRNTDDQAARGLRLALMDKGIATVGDRIVQVRHTDTRGQIEAYEAQAVRLVSLNKVAALYGGDTAEEVERLDRARVPVLSPLGYRPAGTSDRAFFVGLSPSFQGSTLARFAVDRLSYLSFLALAPNPFPRLAEQPPAFRAMILKDERVAEAELLTDAFVETWKDTWAERGEEAVAAPTVLSFGKDASWEELAASVSQMQPACIVFVGAPADFHALLTHLSPRALLLYAGEDGSLRDPPPGQPVFQATAFALDSSEEPVQAFVKKYRETFKAEPGLHAALAYDGMRLLAAGLRKSIANKQSLAFELRHLKDVSGLTGKLAFGPGQVVQRPAFVTVSEGARARVEWRRDPK